MTELARILPNSGLVGSLWLFPLLLLLVLAVRRSARRRVTNWDLSLLGPSVIAVGLLHDRLGIPGSERLVAATLYLAACLIVLRTAPHLVERLRREQRVGWQFFALAATFYLVLAPWATNQRPPNGDEPWNLLVVHSLVHDLDDDLSNNYANQSSLAFMDTPIEPQPGDPARRDGGIRSRHAMLLPLVLVPSYWIAGFSGSVIAMIIMTAALCLLTARVCYDLQTNGGVEFKQTSGGEASATVLAWALLTLTAPLLFYSHQIWVEVPAALLLLLGFIQVRTIGRAAESSGMVQTASATLRVHARPVVTLLLVFILLPLLKLRFGLLAAALAAVFVLRSRLPKRQLVLVGGASLAALAAVLIYNQITYGNALRIHSWSELTASQFMIKPIVLRLAGLLFDPAFGLFPYAPLWAVIIPGYWLQWRRDPRMALDLAILFSPYILVVASRSEWYGGWSPPFRYAAVLLPFLAIIAAEAFRRRRSFGARILLAPLFVVSAAAGALWTARPGWTYNFANGSAYWVDKWTELSGVDWMRWLPSAARPSIASWLVPLCLSIAFFTVWILPKTKRRSRLAAALGLTALITLAAVGTAAARRAPTNQIEAESIAIVKTGGHPEPRRWTLDRTLYREGWTLRHGERMIIPVQPGGKTVQLTFAMRLIRNRQEDLDIHLFAGDRQIGGFRLSERETWSEQSLGPIDWEQASYLTIEVGPPLSNAEPGVVNGVAIDFVDFDWR